MWVKPNNIGSDIGYDIIPDIRPDIGRDIISDIESDVVADIWYDVNLHAGSDVSCGQQKSTVTTDSEDKGRKK